MFDIYQVTSDENGEQDDEFVADYCDGLMQEFAASPEGSAAAEYYGKIGWAYSLFDFGFTYLGIAPPKLSRADVEEILFDIFPRKVSTEPESAAEIIGEFRAFFEFLHRQYALPHAKDILQDLGNDAIHQLEQELSNEGNFGMAKSFVMMGKQAGFDMTTQEGMTEFMLAFNATMAARQMAHEVPDSPEPPSNSTLPSSPKPSSVRMSGKDRRSREKRSERSSASQSGGDRNLNP